MAALPLAFFDIIALEKGINMSDGIISDSAFPEKYQQNTVTSPRKRSARSSNTKSKEDNTISSNAADAALAKKKIVVKEEDTENKVALWSNRNKYLAGAGSLSTGYNIVKKEASELWLNVSGVRVATPEEVAAYYGK